MEVGEGEDRAKCLKTDYGDRIRKIHGMRKEERRRRDGRKGLPRLGASGRGER